jgi:hypothetical protein
MDRLGAFRSPPIAQHSRQRHLATQPFASTARTATPAAVPRTCCCRGSRLAQQSARAPRVLPAALAVSRHLPGRQVRPTVKPSSRLRGDHSRVPSWHGFASPIPSMRAAALQHLGLGRCLGDYGRAARPNMQRATPLHLAGVWPQY